MTAYVEVAVCLPQVLGTFHYHVPPHLPVEPGLLVEVPFGREDRPVQGVVLGWVEQPEVPVTKPVTRIIDAEAVLTRLQIALARRMVERWRCSLAEAVALMLPPGVARMAEDEYRLTAQAPPTPEGLSRLERRLWQVLREHGPLRTGQLQRRMGPVDWKPLVQAWQRRGWVERTPVLPRPRVGRRWVAAVALALSPQALEHPEDLPLGRPGSEARKRRLALLRWLQDRGGGPVDVAEAYAETGATPQDLRYLEQKGLIHRVRVEHWRDPLPPGVTVPQPQAPPRLTPHQQAVWERLQTVLAQALEQGRPVAPVLLHGVTGSGKTELYLRAAAWVLERGRQVLFLVPEIGLATQLVERVLARFPGKVGVLHSGLSLGQRYDTWRRARRGELALLVGARSAVFAPLPRLGLVVVDECHAESYAQQDHGPYYHAREVALEYAALARGVALLGSATPEVTTYYRARHGHITLLTLRHRVVAGRAASAQPAPLPQVQVIDLRAVWRQGHTGPLSPPLLEALEDTLRRGEQAVLFLNRRGTSTQVTCRDCGHVLRCPRCQVPLVYHQTAGRLLCHHCHYTRRWPRRCPACGSEALTGLGWGTQRLEAFLRERFPQARIYRWDRDAVTSPQELSLLLEHFRQGRADILIGTQVLAKGLDLPAVTLVGVVLADIGLTLPDYRAAERTFQVLTQVVGRAGRGERPGRAFIQTYMPQHYAVQAAAAQDYEAFYRAELRLRQRLGYPPFTRLVRLEVRARDPHQAEEEARELAQRLRARLQAVQARATYLVGPAPCFFSPRAGWYRWHILLRGPNPVRWLHDFPLPAGWRVQVDPVSLL